MDVTEIKINTEKIKLDQFLKWADVLPTGGMAKNFIMDGLVKVNGQIETRRGRQIEDGDIVDVEDFGTFRVVKS